MRVARLCTTVLCQLEAPGSSAARLAANVFAMITSASARVLRPGSDTVLDTLADFAGRASLDLVWGLG